MPLSYELIHGRDETNHYWFRRGNMSGESASTPTEAFLLNTDTGAGTELLLLNTDTGAGTINLRLNTNTEP